MTLAIGTFAVSLAGIIGLFVLKYREMQRGQAYLPALRDYADLKARDWKHAAEALNTQMKLLPPILGLISRKIVHELALAFAVMARRGEEQAEKLAEFVSHKHRFERRPPRSEFLMRVGEGRAQIEAENASDANDAGSR